MAKKSIKEQTGKMIRFIFEHPTTRVDAVAKRLRHTMGIHGVVEYPTKVRFQIVAENFSVAMHEAARLSKLNPNNIYLCGRTGDQIGGF